MITTTSQTSGNYDHHPTIQLLKVFEQGPARVRDAICDLSEADMKLHLISGKWSIFEIVIHLSEGEIVGACRFRQALANHTDPFPWYEEAVWAQVMQYQQQSLQFLNDNISMFGMLRKTTADLLRRCSPDDWQKSGNHPKRGRTTVRQLLEIYADHSERHLVQILQRRELLGKPKQMDILLEDRLDQV